MSWVGCLWPKGLARSTPTVSEIERVVIAEQRRGTPGMQEDNPLALLEMTLADQIDQARGPLGRINRIKQDRFQLGEHADRLQPAFGGNAIAFADIVGIGDHILALNHTR